MYRHYRVSRMTEKAGRVLAALFQTYMTEPRQMPEHVVARAIAMASRFRAPSRTTSPA